MATQEQLFELLKSEKVESQYDPAVPLSAIIPPTDSLEPSAEAVESARDDGLIEPLLLNALNGLFEIISGRRRYRMAELAGLGSVPAMITRVSPAKRAILTIKLHKLRAANFLADVDALEVLVGEGFSEKQIEDLTSLLPQERKRRMRLTLADKRLMEALRAGRLSISLAEMIAKLPTAHQAQVLDKLRYKERLCVSDVHEVKEARTRAAVDALPQELFTSVLDLPHALNGNAHPTPVQDAPRTEAERLLAALEALQTSGALDFKNNKLSRRAAAKAKALLSELGKRSMLDEPESTKLALGASV